MIFGAKCFSDDNFYKGRDPFGHFFCIDFFAGKTCWRSNMQKIILMGCLKRQDETLKNFHSQPKKWPILKILASNPENRFGILFLTRFTICDHVFESLRTILMQCS